jgi:hypothetical protein
MTEARKAISGDYTTAELVALRDRRIAWRGDRDTAAVADMAALCKDALDQIGQDGEAIGAEITAGEVTALLHP